jgi:hypothetical protein
MVLRTRKSNQELEHNCFQLWSYEHESLTKNLNTIVSSYGPSNAKVYTHLANLTNPTHPTHPTHHTQHTHHRNLTFRTCHKSNANHTQITNLTNLHSRRTLLILQTIPTLRALHIINNWQVLWTLHRCFIRLRVLPEACSNCFQSVLRLQSDLEASWRSRWIAKTSMTCSRHPKGTLDLRKVY